MIIPMGSMVLSLAMPIVGVVLGVLGIRFRFETQVREERLRWMIDQIDRALEDFCAEKRMMH